MADRREEERREEEKLDPEELAAWRAGEPPEGFEDRVLAARRAGAGDRDDARAAGARGRRLGLSALVALAAATAVALLWPAGGGGAAEGELRAEARESVDIGGRGKAVAEAGSALSWRVSAQGAAVIDQERGDVFYRAEPGGPFTVVTPAGRITVTGTCFRVEVEPMKPSKQAVAGAALGAAVVVTVYEGSVLFANDEGSAEVAAGESAAANGEGPPVLRGARGDSQAEEAAAGAAGDLSAPAANASREELLARDRGQREELAQLRRKVRELEDSLGDARRRSGAGGPGEEGDEPWFDPDEETLKQMAEDCELRIDLPPMLGSDPYEISSGMAEELSLTDRELAAANDALARLHREARSKIRALYIELTGDARGADLLSPQAMARELRDKSPPREEARVRERIARERAGLVPPPADLSGATPLERYYRYLASLGDAAEESVGEIIGRSRARELRSENGGWGSRMKMRGCAEERRPD